MRTAIGIYYVLFGSDRFRTISSALVGQVAATGRVSVGSFVVANCKEVIMQEGLQIRYTGSTPLQVR